MKSYIRGGRRATMAHGAVVGQPFADDAEESVTLLTLSISATAQIAPELGRQLFSEMLVVSTEGAVVGRGGVAIGSVA